MKELIRLKTITSSGRILLSPFVFREEEAKRRVRSASKTFERGLEARTELVRVSRYPLGAIWSKKKHGGDRKTISKLILSIRVLTSEWEVIEDANNRENA